MITNQTHEGLQIVQSEQLLEVGLPHGWFGTSLGNLMYRGDDPEQRAAMVDRWTNACTVLGMNAARLTRTTGLVQSDIVTHIDERSAGNLAPEADGYVTTERDMPVMLRAADCTQTVLYDPRAEVLGVVHAGGLGAARGVVGKTVQMMQHYDADPANMLAGIGPSISAVHFRPTREVDRFELTPEGVRVWSEDGMTVIEEIAVPSLVREIGGDGRVGYDVAATVVEQLIDSGVAPQRIDVSTIDTYASPEFYSYERDRQTDPTAAMSRHGLFVGLPRVTQN